MKRTKLWRQGLSLLKVETQNPPKVIHSPFLSTLPSLSPSLSIVWWLKSDKMGSKVWHNLLNKLPSTSSSWNGQFLFACRLSHHSIVKSTDQSFCTCQHRLIIKSYDRSFITVRLFIPTIHCSALRILPSVQKSHFLPLFRLRTNPITLRQDYGVLNSNI
jgi:hypothetical protein